MPSRSWARGSTRAWRRVRAAVLERDGYRCQLRLPGCTTAATEVHHTVGREVSGDDPGQLVAACRSCNQRVGDPRRHDPAPRPRTQWSR
jgi:5-methylcytosine-specific restriction endonuclease McrA